MGDPIKFIVIGKTHLLERGFKLLHEVFVVRSLFKVQPFAVLEIFLEHRWHGVAKELVADI